ncbi:bglg family transcriptional antiterminator [Paenibacillus terrae HPL-003]|uniref:Bglg family transcriptional antiterminator n=1 Tax=Paenibacillus terrae (strain HPL-003) TaxID=985665 RepID=G7W489_PAETH|nr:PRD domain-containing protein [Paenibacillus terrae]AET59727.1 bglg family transcriptional antiterminator [Paenibacillus terrae HPL-003]
MKIAKVLNNNVVTVIDEQQKELVIMGRGIAFKKSAGDEIDEGKIEKIFKLESTEVSRKLMTLMSDIPIEYVEISDEIIQYAKTILGVELHDSIYISLTDHIHFAIERYRLGMDIKNALFWEIKRMYRKEFSIGTKALHMIQDKLGVTLPDDEGAFIALHLVNAQLNSEMRETVALTNIVKDIINIVSRFFVIELDEESLTYYRFITHLKFFAQRVMNGTPVQNADNSLHDMVKVQYKSAYACAEKIRDYTAKIYGRSLSQDEMLYLTIHIERIINNQ